MKKIITGLKPLQTGKVALMGADKAGQPTVLGVALIEPKIAENIDENANYEVDLAYTYNLEEKTTKIHVKNFVQTTTDAAKTPLYTTIATEAKVLKVFENNDKFATLVCKLDDGSSVAADAWYKQNSKLIPQVKDNDTWRMNLTLGGVYDGKNKINAFLRSSTSTSATASFTPTTTTTGVEEPAKSTIKKFDFNHLGKALEQKGYGEYQETGKVQMGFITTCEKKTTVFNIRDIETLKLIARQPLALTDTAEKFDIVCRVAGGGVTGQAGAIRHGISRALLQFDENLRPTLKKAGLLTRDPRMKERKKYGLKGARRAPQFSKR